MAEDKSLRRAFGSRFSKRRARSIRPALRTVTRQLTSRQPLGTRRRVVAQQASQQWAIRLGITLNDNPFHLFRYLDEQTFRFNSRKASDSTRFADLLTRLAGKRLTYASLIGEEARAVGLA